MLRRDMGRVSTWLLVVIVSALFFGASTSVHAADPAALHLSVQLVTNGFSSPVYVTNAGDARLFVVEQAGKIRIIKNGALLPTPFLNITGAVLSGGERGLLSVAFHPQYATNGLFFVFHTIAGGDNVIERYRVTANPDLADANSGTHVLTIPHAINNNHNGGLLAFGPDGYLYLGTGDGGGGGDPAGNGQNTASLSGKILRIDVNGGSPYAIPASNPFANDMTGKKKEIWAYGLRNPWRYAFDPPSGSLYIADVGQGNWEEVNVVPATAAGINYGWNVTEGAHCYPPGTTTCDTAGITLPVAEYDHSLGCSITGGFVYRGAAYPRLVGLYLFADYCSGRIWALDQPNVGTWRRTELLDTSHAITSFGTDRNGELYLTDGSEGGVYRIVVASVPLPVSRTGSGNLTGPVVPPPSPRVQPLGDGTTRSPLPVSRT